MAGETSLEELQARLETFTEQLQSIHELLQSDAENAEFLGIAADLVEVIRLTKDAIDLKLAAATEAHEDQQPVASVAPELAFEPGDVVEAQSKGVWYPARVESVTASDTYNVVYLGFGNKDELAETALRAIKVDATHAGLPAREAVTEGFKCEAKYYVDSQYYPCSVTKVTAYGFQVLFEGYGNSEEVPFEYMRPLSTVVDSAASSSAAPSAVASTGASAAVKPAAASAPAKLAPVVIDKPIQIPENLQILPTDTEAEKERKRKRIRAIKSLNRHKNIDNERNVKQHDWKAFQHKAVKKKVKGASGVLSKRGTSMFASPDSVNGRVGVVGSGQGMTEYNDARKKVKRGHAE